MKYIDEIIDGFLDYLKSVNQLDHLPQIIKRLEEKLEEEKKTAYVTTAIPLTQDEEEKIKNFLKENFHQDLKIKIIIDPEIIGGLKINVGDRVIDQTITGRLSSLVDNLSK